MAIESISEERKREIADRFAELLLENGHDSERAAKIVAEQYGLEEEDVEEIVSEVQRENGIEDDDDREDA